MPGLQPPRLSNVLIQGENILNSRAQRDPNSLNNQLLRGKINALNDPQQGNSTAEIKNFNFYQKLNTQGKATFDHMLRGQNIKKIGEVWNIVLPDNSLFPLGSLAEEVQAQTDIAQGVEAGKQTAQLEALPKKIDLELGKASALGELDLQQKPEIAKQVAIGSAEGADEVRVKIAARKDLKAFKSYEVVKKNVMDSMNNTFLNGYYLGKLPATTASAQIAEQAVNILFPAIKKIVREGESGVFTDQDAMDVRSLLPNRETHPEALPMAMWQLDSWVASRLGQAQPPKPGESPTTTGQTQTAPQSVQEGQTATNPTTGQRIIFRGGQWQAQ